MPTPQLELIPRLVRADAETEVLIRSTAPEARLADETEYEVTVCPMEGKGADGAAAEAVFRLRPTNGALRIRRRFVAEQEHSLHVSRVKGDEKTPLADLRVYALAPDLFARRPFKGDLHLHSNRSDGREPPAHVAAACRSIGLDFMAVTDHGLYEPSLEAQRAFADVPIALRIFPGEEVHPGGPVHIVNFGARHSVQAMLAQSTACSAEIQALAAAVDDPALAAAQCLHYAQALWTCRQIRSAGGLAIFCHPYWVEGRRYNVSDPLITRLLAEQPYDALEVIGGYGPRETESNLLQVARYHDARAVGQRIPIVGSSDSHGCEGSALFGRFYTIVFSVSDAPADLLQSMKDFYSVAVEALPEATPRAHGPFRFAKYAQFLLREVFPQHDILSQEEGRLMFAHLAGDARSAAALRALQGQTAAYYANLRGSNP